MLPSSHSPLYTYRNRTRAVKLVKDAQMLGRTRTEVSPLPAQCFCPDLRHPRSYHPQKIGTKSLGDSTPHSDGAQPPWASSRGQSPCSMNLPGSLGSWAPGMKWNCFQQGCVSQPLPVPAQSPWGHQWSHLPVHLAGMETLDLLLLA